MMRTLWLAVAVSVLAVATGSAWAEEAKPMPQAKPEEVEKVRAAMPEKAIVKPEKVRKLLIYSAAKGFVHDSIPIGAEAIKMLGEKTGAWEGTISTDPRMFSADKLKDFDGVFMNNTTGTLFKEENLKTALLEFVKGGKGIAGCHSSTDCFYDWKAATQGFRALPVIPGAMCCLGSAREVAITAQPARRTHRWRCRMGFSGWTAMDRADRPRDGLSCSGGG